MNKNLLGGEGEKERREKNKKISTLLLIMEVDFCPALCIAGYEYYENERKSKDDENN